MPEYPHYTSSKFVDPEPPAPVLIDRDVRPLPAGERPIRTTGRVPSIDGHSPLVVGLYTRDDSRATIDDNGVIRGVEYVAADGRPSHWATTLPGWSDAIASDVKRGRNKRGPTARVLRHGVVWQDVNYPDQDDRLAGATSSRLRDRDLSDMATHWARMACMACADVREACEADGHTSDVTMCRECAHGCGCMPDALGMPTLQTADMIDGPLSRDGEAPAPRPVVIAQRGKGKGRPTAASAAHAVKRAKWIAETQSRADQGWSSVCHVARHHDDIAGTIAGAFNGAGRAVIRERFANLAALVESGKVRLPWPTNHPRRPNFTGDKRAAARKAAGVAELGTDADGRTMIGRRSGNVTLLVGPSFDGAYWLGHRHVRPKTRKRSVVTSASINRATVAQAAADAIRANVAESMLVTLRAMPTGQTRRIGGHDVERIAGGRWLIDGKSLPIIRAAARCGASVLAQ